MNLLPMFLGSGGGGISGILGNVTGAFGGLISDVGNTLTGMSGNNQPVLKKSNNKIYYVIGGVSVVMVLGIVIAIVKKK
jgi:hypothetical protein